MCGVQAGSIVQLVPVSVASTSGLGTYIITITV